MTGTVVTSMRAQTPARRRCGDGFLREDLAADAPGFEGCDDGNNDPADGCSAICGVEICGNGIVDPNDACDDGNQINTDACTNNCEVARCGDGSCVMT